MIVDHSQPSLSRISQTESPPYLALLLQWLQACDKSHGCKSSANFWPTRVIYVGDSEFPVLELWETKSKQERLHKDVDYVALSYRWGPRPTNKEKKQFCTTSENYDQQLENLTIDKALKTFCHAVEVTRALRKKYLWIDALCIIQTTEDRKSSDWDTEAKLMEEVFGSAYCTIAATSAENWKEGFLEPELLHDFCRQRLGNNLLKNFQNDVDAGPLNKRAWVLQERVLSRRTIHFTRNCIYWTCGFGLASENSGRIIIPTGPGRLYLDPNFPSCFNGSAYTYTAAIKAIQSLFEKYAQSVLSEKPDREVAISGLLKRMEGVLKTECRFGIFARFLSRLLLWRRPDGTDSNESDYKGLALPSWSWMTYTRISFPSAESLQVPVDANLKFDPERKNVLLVQVRELQLQNCKQNNQESNYFVLDAEPKKVSFDTTNCSAWQCVVIATANGNEQDTTCHILLVKKTSGIQYERVGLGKIKARYVSEESSSGELC
ncbi:heterokaryon incompatibility protein-domain-containing protein [Bisporella sp. PMI_857]|nr:heterokaryon incompatibility protein-domain-containing protein [Bisporella sp. PMI_857]